MRETKSPYPGEGTITSPYLVDFLPDEPQDPYNWSKSRKWLITIMIAWSCLCIAFTSTSFSAAIPDLVVAFPGTDQETAIAGISLYVLGFGVGPLVWAPVSEMFGRNIAFYCSYPFFVLWNMATPLSPNMTAILIFRFLAGTFGSAPLTNSGGIIGDIWRPKDRATATSIFALAPFLGPVIGPVVGGFTSQGAGYRAVLWVQFGFGAIMCIICILFVPETYAPTLLRKKARFLQKKAIEEGSPEIYISKFDVNRKTKLQILRIGMTRPFQMIARELIVFCLGVYAAIIYGTLYLFFTAYPIVFQLNRGWSQGQGGLAFLGIGVGLLLGNALNPLGNIWYNRAVKLAGPGGRVPPEARLPMCCVGAVLCPIGLFWFAWTCTPDIHWIVPIIGSIPFGTGFLLIFTGMTNYLIDSYTLYAASALAANAVFRSLFGTIFPLFSVRLYTNLGLNHAGTLVACLSLMCTPMPFLFYRYGPYLRRNSKYAPPADPETSTTVAAGGKDEIEDVEKVRTPMEELEEARAMEALEPGLSQPVVVEEEAKRS